MRTFCDIVHSVWLKTLSSLLLTVAFIPVCNALTILLAIQSFSKVFNTNIVLAGVVNDSQCWSQSPKNGLPVRGDLTNAHLNVILSQVHSHSQGLIHNATDNLTIVQKGNLVD